MSAVVWYPVISLATSPLQLTHLLQVPASLLPPEHAGTAPASEASNRMFHLPSTCFPLVIPIARSPPLGHCTVLLSLTPPPNALF